MLNGIQALLMANSFTAESLEGAGALKGEKGDPGKPGVSVTKVEINDDKHLTVELSDGTETDAGRLPDMDINISEAPGNKLKKMDDGSLFSSGSDAPFSSVDEESFEIDPSAELNLKFETTDIDYEHEF